MNYEDKRSDVVDRKEIQQGNQAWWTGQKMSYDWNDKSQLEPLTKDWFADIDQRFLHAARLFSTSANPFDALMSTDQLRGKRILEIGCGMGFHSELLAAAGGHVTSIDLSSTSAQATIARLELKNLPADVRQMDAERLAFPSESFDMIWSWGVVHHSSRTGRIVREMERVLRPGGSVRVMVYNLEGMPAYVTFVRRYLTGFWRGRSLDELLWQSTDGFSARFYTRDSLADLFLTFFDKVEIAVLGQDADVVPLPQFLRRFVLGWVPEAHQRAVIRRRGAYLFASATKNG